VVLELLGKETLGARAEEISPRKPQAEVVVGQVLSALMALELLAVMVAQVHLIQFLDHQLLMLVAAVVAVTEQAVLAERAAVVLVVALQAQQERQTQAAVVVAEAHLDHLAQQAAQA